MLDFYLRLDVRKIGLDLDEGLMTKIFGPLPSPADSNRVLPIQKKSFPDLNSIPDCQSIATSIVTIKCERIFDSQMDESDSDDKNGADDEHGAGDQNGRITEVDVKCEPMSDSEMAQSDSEMDPSDFVAVKQEFTDEENES